MTQLDYMAATYCQIEPGFSTADAEHPTLEYRDGDLMLQFVDWQEKRITVRFPFAVAFRWQDDGALAPDIRDDMIYEVV